MSCGDKMTPFLDSEMAWVCHVIFLTMSTFIQTILYSQMNELMIKIYLWEFYDIYNYKVSPKNSGVACCYSNIFCDTL